MRASGFTLIELLVVIAIIGILATVLIPNLLGARKRAFDTAAQMCATAIAKGQEINMIDNSTYAGAIAGLQGTNVCEGLTITGESGDTDTYSATVEHPDGSGAKFTVKPDGVVKN